ncbi:uncharacterized protein MELLADRAFT_66758 [Melampsora larici-populina 98AG31]|uniref:Uncharacterized protein n=1 Tax=Melampsora larici-populina (strain 98AG31 / pathotype 3-4-7) TaxID=747676 RepID=F4S0G2_MELLP|nr:uncharacterized protein MELLADRAFT_66758 [Melampsora larici-populina 98AG31]EGG01760.1 hypothetical protein MELLADRAFT_66758 [Melampsora larici-populina 98AG31]
MSSTVLEHLKIQERLKGIQKGSAPLEVSHMIDSFRIPGPLSESKLMSIQESLVSLNARLDGEIKRNDQQDAVLFLVQSGLSFVYLLKLPFLFRQGRQKLERDLDSFNTRTEKTFKTFNTNFLNFESTWTGKQEDELRTVNSWFTQLESQIHADQTKYTKLWQDQLDTLSHLKDCDEKLGQATILNKKQHINGGGIVTDQSSVMYMMHPKYNKALELLIGTSDQHILDLQNRVEEQNNQFNHKSQGWDEHKATSMDNHSSVVRKLEDLNEQITKYTEIHNSSETLLLTSKDHEGYSKQLVDLRQQITDLRVLEETRQVAHSNQSTILPHTEHQSLMVPNTEQLLEPIHEKMKTLELLINRNQATLSNQSLIVPNVYLSEGSSPFQEPLLEPIHEKMKALESLIHCRQATHSDRSLIVTDTERLLEPIHEKVKALESLIHDNQVTQSNQSLIVPNTDEILEPVHTKIKALESMISSNQAACSKVNQSLILPNVEQLLEPIREKVKALESLINCNQVTTTQSHQRFAVRNTNATMERNPSRQFSTEFSGSNTLSDSPSGDSMLCDQRSTSQSASSSRHNSSTTNMGHTGGFPSGSNDTRGDITRLASHNSMRTPGHLSRDKNPFETPTFSSRRKTTATTAAPKRPSKWIRPGQVNRAEPRSSLRQQRENMEDGLKDDDQNLTRALQYHFRLVANVARKKLSFPRSPTKANLEALPVLSGSIPLGPAAPFVITNAQVSQTWDDDETTPEGFSDYCIRRLRQYGLPFVGLSSAFEREDPNALEWNERTLAFCIDTFHHMLTVAGEYDHFFGVDQPEIDNDRVEELLRVHFEYRISNKRMDQKKANAIQDHQQYNRRRQRCKGLALRRLDACLSVPSLLPYKDLFRDERLCSSDESDNDVLEEDRVRRVPVYRSRVGTMLVEHVDKMYRQLRQDEAQKRAGRKPAKRITSTTKHATDSQRWPVGLPSDCVDELFMIKIGAKAVRALKLRDPILQNIPVLATSNV